MKKRATVLSVAVVAGGLTSGAWAQERSAAETAGKSAAPSRAAAVESSVSGTVATIDHKTGKVEVKTGHGMAAEGFAASPRLHPGNPKGVTRLGSGADGGSVPGSVTWGDFPPSPVRGRARGRPALHSPPAPPSGSPGSVRSQPQGEERGQRGGRKEVLRGRHQRPEQGKRAVTPPALPRQGSRSET
jgi:hypothetical protein